MSLRVISERDLEQILEWRNSEAVRLNMFSQKLISLEQHRAWFQRTKENKSSVWWLYVDVAGRPSGVIYFNDIDSANGLSFWGFYVNPDAAKGTGSTMAKEAIVKGFSELGLRKIYGDVLEFNRRSQDFHERLGFVKEGIMRAHHKLNDRYYDVVRYGLLYSDWIAHAKS